MKTFHGETHLEKLTDRFWKVLSNLVLLCFSSMLVIMVLQVLFRYVLKISVPWTDEAARSLFIWEIFLGCALASLNKPQATAPQDPPSPLRKVRLRPY